MVTKKRSASGGQARRLHREALCPQPEAYVFASIFYTLPRSPASTGCCLGGLHIPAGPVLSGCRVAPEVRSEDGRKPGGAAPAGMQPNGTGSDRLHHWDGEPARDAFFGRADERHPRAVKGRHALGE